MRIDPLSPSTVALQHAHGERPLRRRQAGYVWLGAGRCFGPEAVVNLLADLICINATP